MEGGTEESISRLEATNIGIMGKRMETTIVISGYIGFAVKEVHPNSVICCCRYAAKETFHTIGKPEALRLEPATSGAPLHVAVEEEARAWSTVRPYHTLLLSCMGTLQNAKLLCLSSVGADISRSISIGSSIIGYTPSI